MNINWLAIYIASSIYGVAIIAGMVIGASIMSSSPGSTVFNHWREGVACFGLSVIPVVNTVGVIVAPLLLLVYYRKGFTQWWYWLYSVIASLMFWSLWIAANWK